MSNIKNGGLDQYGPEPLKQQQFGTVGVEGVNQQNKVKNTCLVPVSRVDVKLDHLLSAASKHSHRHC